MGETGGWVLLVLGTLLFSIYIYISFHLTQHSYIFKHIILYYSIEIMEEEKSIE